MSVVAVVVGDIVAMSLAALVESNSRVVALGRFLRGGALVGVASSISTTTLSVVATTEERGGETVI